MRAACRCPCWSWAKVVATQPLRSGECPCALWGDTSGFSPDAPRWCQRHWRASLTGCDGRARCSLPRRSAAGGGPSACAVASPPCWAVGCGVLSMAPRPRHPRGAPAAPRAPALRQPLLQEPWPCWWRVALQRCQRVLASRPRGWQSQAGACLRPHVSVASAMRTASGPRCLHSRAALLLLAPFSASTTPSTW